MRNKVATIGLVAFLAVDVGLVALALRPGRPATVAPSTGTPTAVVTTTGASTTKTPATTPTGTATDTATGTAAPGQGPKPAPVALLIGALDATTAWRASTGSCEKGGSALSVTADGGETWDETKSPARSVIRVQPLDEDRVFAVAAGADCELKQYASNDRGDSWQAPSAVSGGWARQLDEPTEVLTPQNDRAQPCGASTDVIDLSRTSADQAQALCADGAVTVTGNGGESWADAGTAKGGLALGNRLESGRLTTYVARVSGDCPGIELVRVAKGKSLDRVSCIGTSVPTKAGQIGLSIVGEAGWLVAADSVWTATADLTTWKQP
ncbi:hypothetical protein [Humibacillus xanthopallidus]|uniref:hypothetical protein n=1 Tax=Humibacillus xanthopallidus TaxID=412689 RepID=UPI0038501C5C